jgi:hypothetical protein
MYWNKRDRPIPHFHAIQAERRASVAIDGVVLAGELERRALDLVRRNRDLPEGRRSGA